MRASGMLLPVASLPSRYGIGCFSKEAYEFVDMLRESSQKYWQILPLGPTGYGDSPYQSFSTFAGNPYFIDLEKLEDQGLLTRDELESFNFGNDPEQIDYEKIYNTRFKVLKNAFKRRNLREDAGFEQFCRENSDWLEDYSLYMSVKGTFDGKSWSEWDEDIRLREPSAMEKYRIDLAEEILFYEYLQYEFMKQWAELKGYANERGIQIVGDIPIYVAFDSSDTWANPQLFQLDENNTPIGVAGCPPDGFSETGQLWGNPLYRWDYHKETGYEWWIRRIEYCCKLYDMVRIDHFRGFDEYYSIPYGAETAVDGKWLPGPGMDIFNTLGEKLGDMNIIAEDLGFLTNSVRKLLKDSGYPGMKVLQFAFDSREDSDYLPHNYIRNCIVYTGTHDNDTLRGWYESISPEDKEMVKDYLNNHHTPDEEINWDLICLALSTVADICIIPVQEYLGLGKEARINTPSTLGGNWEWRMGRDAFTLELIEKIKDRVMLFGRGHHM